MFFFVFERLACVREQVFNPCLLGQVGISAWTAKKSKSRRPKTMRQEPTQHQCHLLGRFGPFSTFRFSSSRSQAVRLWRRMALDASSCGYQFSDQDARSSSSNIAMWQCVSSSRNESEAWSTIPQVEPEVAFHMFHTCEKRTKCLGCFGSIFLGH